MWKTVLLCVLVVVACDTSTTSTTAPTTTLPPSPSTTSEATTTTMGQLACPQEEDFIGTGQIDRITQPSSDSRTLGLVSRQVEGQCERFGFDFDTAGDAPATTPPSMTARFLEGSRVIRISMDIDRTVITDQLIETRLVDRLYVVKGLDGTMFVDLHLREKAVAKVTVTNSPARLTLELAPGVGDIGPAPLFSDRTVLITPPGDGEVGSEVEVTGYARNAEANVMIVATAGNDVVLETSTTAADWLETWGEFEEEISLPSGTVNLFVGEASPADGSLQGVTVGLTVR